MSGSCGSTSGTSPTGRGSRALATYGRDVVIGVIERDYFGMRTLPLSVRNFWVCVFWPDSLPSEHADPKER
ncbi:MAG: hypothetical protein ACP5P9_08275 [Acidimicrobiales bacterium]